MDLQSKISLWTTFNGSGVLIAPYIIKKRGSFDRASKYCVCVSESAPIFRERAGKVLVSHLFVSFLLIFIFLLWQYLNVVHNKIEIVSPQRE